MSRYIDADAIDYRNDRIQDQSADFIGGIVYANACIKEAPSIDIVRCKECGYWEVPGMCLNFMTEDKNGFCSWAERRE